MARCNILLRSILWMRTICSRLMRYNWAMAWCFIISKPGLSLYRAILLIDSDTRQILAAMEIQVSILHDTSALSMAESN